METNAYPNPNPPDRLYYECGQFTLPLTSPDEFLIEKSPYYAERFSRTAKDNGNYLRKQELKDWGNTPVLQNLRNSVIDVSPY